LPPFQLRLSKNWRVSKFLLPIFGIDADGWMHAVRIGDITLVGTPADYCGEISVDLKSRMQNHTGDLWVLSFNGDYVGYISPDRYYYDEDEKGGYGYERGVMSWIGPDQEAFTVSLIMYMINALFPEDQNTCEFQSLKGNHDDVTGGAVARTFLCDKYLSLSIRISTEGIDNIRLFSIFQLYLFY